MTEQQLQQLQQRLLEEKQDILASNALHEGDEVMEDVEGIDNHPADQGTELADEYVEQALDEQREEELEKIEQALAAIEAGTYGKCTVCDEQIPYERLESLPTAVTCVNHSN